MSAPAGQQPGTNEQPGTDLQNRNNERAVKKRTANRVPDRPDTTGKVFGVFFLVVAALVILPLLIRTYGVGNVGSVARLVVAPLLLLAGAAGLILVSRRRG